MVFCCCCRRCSRLSCCLETVSQLPLVDLPVLCVLRVWRAWRVFHVSCRLRCFCCLFFVDRFCRSRRSRRGDQGLDFARSAWGFLSKNGLLSVSTYKGCGDWRPCDDNRRHEMGFVMILTTLSRRFCRVCQRGRLVASRQIVAMASLFAFEVFASRGSGVSRWERRR